MKSFALTLTLAVSLTTLTALAQEGSPAYEACMKKQLPPACADLQRLSAASKEIERREAALRKTPGGPPLAESAKLHKEWADLNSQAEAAQRRCITEIAPIHKTCLSAR